MAKSNFLAMMKAKPNARGKRSHLPLYCSVKNCEEDFIVSHPLINGDSVPKRYCTTHSAIFTPPQKSDRDKLELVLALLN